MSKNIRDIKTFTDYRAFLKIYAHEAKLINGQWTYGVWAKQLNLKDTSSLTKIINGQRHPGDEITQKLCSFFKFNSKDSSYFKDLVSIYKNQNNPRLCLALMEKMGKKFPNSDLSIIDTSSFELVSAWYIFPLRELVRTPWFSEDYELISKHFKFKVTAVEIKKGIELLLKANLLRRDNQGKLEISHGRISTTFDQKNEAIQLSHKSMLENAQLALKTQNVHEREFIGLCLNIRPENIERAKILMREFKDKFEELLEENEGTQLYQMQMQLFSLTNKYESGETNEIN